jgi:hypothetical protein
MENMTETSQIPSVDQIEKDFTEEFIPNLVKEVGMFGGNNQMTYDAIKKSNYLRKEFAKLIVATNGGEKNRLHIPAQLSLADRIASGMYDRVDTGIINGGFQVNIQVDYDVEYKLFGFDRPMKFLHIIQEMKAEKYHAAILPELLVLGEREPELQLRFPIFALDTWQMSFGPGWWVKIPVLYHEQYSRKRELQLSGAHLYMAGVSEGSEFGEHCRFLAISD